VSQPEISFIADVMLGKLARDLRMLGVDVRYSNDADDSEIVRIAELERRVILTRDAGLSARRMSVRCLLIECSHASDQLRQVVAAFDLDRFDYLTRCLECNMRLESVSRDAVAERVPPFVYRTQERFAVCRSCNRVFWHGTHVDDMLKRIGGGR
jgi:uncharacterized protein with PIN domain